MQITNATQHGNSEDAGKEGEDGQKQGEWQWQYEKC